MLASCILSPALHADSAGDVVQFYQSNFITGGYEVVSGKCLRVTDGTFFYADAFLGLSKEFLDNFVTDYDTHIQAVVKASCGNPPDVDGDAHVTVLITRIKDETGMHKAYFSTYNQHQSSENGYENSNHREIIYVDYDYYINDKLETRRQTAVGLVEMIAWNYQPAKSAFLVQMLRQYATRLLGLDFPETWINEYRQNSISLFETVVSKGYMAKCFMLMLYLVEKYDTNRQMIKYLVQTQEDNGMEAIVDATGVSFNEALSGFASEVFNRAQNTYQKSSSQFFFTFPSDTSEIQLKSYEPVGIRLSKFWPEYSLVISGYSGDPQDDLKVTVHYFRNELLVDSRTVNYNGGAVYAPEWDLSAGEAVAVFMSCAGSGTETLRGAKFAVNYAAYGFSYFSNPIFREQVFLFFKGKYTMNAASVTDPDGGNTALSLKTIDSANYFAGYTAKDAGNHLVTVSGHDESGNPCSASYTMKIGSGELDQDGMY